MTSTDVDGVRDRLFESPIDTPHQPLGRRTLLRLGAGATAALALVGLRPFEAEAASLSQMTSPGPTNKEEKDEKDDKNKKTSPLNLATSNVASGLTSLVSSAAGLFVRADTARAIEGKSVSDVGVFGRSTNHVGVVGEGGDRGVHGYSPAGLGMRAASDAGTGIAATSGSPPPSPPGPPSPAPPIAVLAESFNAGGVGIVGKGPDGGVLGASTTGVGVKGDSVGSVGVVARSSAAQGLVASTEAVDFAAIEGVATNTSGATFNTGVFGRVQRGHGLQGHAAQGIGAKGVSDDPSGSGIGVLGDAAAGIGVKGYSRDTTGAGIAVLGEALSGVGLKGYVGAPGGFGMIGEAPSGSGVFGTSSSGNGLHGYSANGLALYAQGRVWFDSLLLVPITAGATVGALSGVPYAQASSFVLATIQDHAIGAHIAYARVPAAGEIEVHLDGPAATSGYAAVLVFN